MSSTPPDLSTLTVPQFQARIIEKSALILGTFVKSTPEDRLRWRPSTEAASNTRSILEQVGECIFANERFMHYLRSEAAPQPPAEWDTFASAKEAIGLLAESGRKLAAMVAQMDAEALAKTYQTHRGPMIGALLIQFPVRNMTYHMGQINFIQLLYGDKEFHTDAEFVTF